MKNHSKIILFVIIIFSIYSSCSANPLSDFMSIFQKDLVLELIYKNHQNLIQGSDVYLAKDPKGQKTLIGEVTKVSLTKTKMSKVNIRIDKRHKDQIYETTPFVLMSNIFSQNANAYIVAISSLDASGKKLLKSGSSVKGITFFEYKFAATGEELKKAMDSIEKQNRELMNQLKDYIDTLNTEEFQQKIDDLTDQITQFSKEQKETFKNDVLPSLKNMFNSIIEQLEKQNNKEKSKNLEKQLKEIEEKVDV